HPPARVYAAWVSSATVIAPATAMDIDPRPGGHYRLLMEMPDFTGRNEGIFSIVEPNQRVRYSWEWNGDGEVTEVEVRFMASGADTEVHITHSGFSSAASRDNHRSGWDSYIEGFCAFLAQQD
ncbi:MAG: SRPBCC domain-containing protein, partial [Pseudomonadales bacterium]